MQQRWFFRGVTVTPGRKQSYQTKCAGFFPIKTQKNTIETTLDCGEGANDNDDVADQGNDAFDEEVGFDGYKLEWDGDNAQEMEIEMAAEAFDHLRGDSPLLSVEVFLNWSEIKDVLDKGYIDMETIEIILLEVGVEHNVFLRSMSFPQFVEVVDLVNQISIALEQERDFGDGTNFLADQEDYEDIDVGDTDTSTGTKDENEETIDISNVQGIPK